MSRFIAELNDGKYINIPADKITVCQDETSLMVYNGTELVAYLDLSAVITAHLSENGGIK